MSLSIPKSAGLDRRALVLLAVVLGWVSVMPTRAAGTAPPNPKDESFDTLKKEYDEAREKFMEEQRKAAEAQLEAAQAKLKAAQAELKAAEKALQDAKTDEEKQAAQKRLAKARVFPAMPAMKMVSRAEGPGETFSPRFLAFAVEHPKDPAAIDAFDWALITCGGPSGKVGTWGKTVKALQADHLENPELKRAVRLFRTLAQPHDEAADNLLRDVMAKNPDRRARGRACQALAQGRERAAELGENLNANVVFRRNNEAYLGGKEGVEKLIADAPKAKREAEELTRTIRAKYDDVCPDLSVGKPGPEVVNQDLDGKTVKLSALKGKVVVLDIWTTWCGPCKAMIPHEREMVGRLKERPFALVSISCDEKKETLTKFIAKQEMPWTHWWNGNEGGILEDWDVQGYPTIYVLDAKGVIRYKDLRGEKLEEAVNKLLEELAKEQD